MALLELSHTKIEGDIRLLRVQRQRFPIVLLGFGQFSLLSQNHTEIAKHRWILRITFLQCPPHYFRVVELTGSHQLYGLGRHVGLCLRRSEIRNPA